MSEEFEVNKNTFVRIGNTHEITMVSKCKKTDKISTIKVCPIKNRRKSFVL
ncbi:MAG: hypothetical protein HFI05_05700 [Lachnospiraceae bacterium]|jgi:hypothetical protein|nr:hypothetical protein [Lachnospiraceae bacterium]